MNSQMTMALAATNNTNRRFARVGQVVLEWHDHKKPFTLANVIGTATDIGKQDQVTVTEGAQPTTQVGTGVYEVQQNDLLVLVSHKFDTGEM